ncbi:MAG: sigma 54-interacting transcriptional regulator [Gemmatimonadetes bacterium]|jgi:DNA-binding NtrC family response regulator|nr:sigma 54-interacting transcriptional regulator [Gemmatimonadota bacterium]MBT7864020.1 sigma 54-interacting transcriptional regulator [Gemmatimonadota bacterium]
MADTELDVRGSRILVVDDTPANLEVLCLALETSGYQVMFADAGQTALDLAARFAPELILLDVTMPGMDGFEVCRRLQQDEQTRSIPVIFLTARGDVDNVVEGLESGGVDYVIKPFRKEEVMARVRTQLERVQLLRELVTKSKQLEEQAQQLSQKNRDLEEEMERRERLTNERDELADRLSHLTQLEVERHGVAGFIGRSPAVQEVLEEIELLRQSHAVSVLVAGESGTGKEGIARAIHFGGSRTKGPFVAVNCAAIPSNLAESSFFGHMRGSFTGAHDAHKGYFEQADGGTLFLDEVGDLPLELQAKLLRTLETASVMPVGGTQEKAVDVRIVSATHRDLTALILQDRFREDLYFRLAGFSVTLPPLRDRREDIAMLVDHFLQEFSKEMGGESPGMSREALSLLEDHEFPGNVRELKNLMEYALIKSQGALIRSEHLRFIEFSGGEMQANERGLSGGPAKVEGGPQLPEERIVAYLRENGSISNTECRNLLSVDLQRASYLLKKLNTDGVLAKHGERRWTRYSLLSATSTP